MHSTGISIDEQGKQHFLDASIAYKRAVLDCINYLHKFGYTKEQVGTCLLACCPIVDIDPLVRLACGVLLWALETSMPISSLHVSLAPVL